MAAGAVLAHTPLDTVWARRGVNEAGWRGAPFFITDTQTGRLQPRTLASQSDPGSAVCKHLPFSISKGGRCGRSGHGQLGNLIKASWG